VNKYTIEVYKETQDDWFPCYKLIHHTNLVIVRFSKLRPETNSNWRVSVWGEDDCGMEWDNDNEATTFNVFLQTIGLEYVNKSNLKSMGFITS
jgi:hypothetical protein